PDRRTGPDRSPSTRVLQEDLRPLGVVDEVVDVLDVRLIDARLPAALVRDPRRPDLRRVERREQGLIDDDVGAAGARPAALERGERDVVDVLDARHGHPTRSRLAVADPDELRHQYTARPPEMSKHAPV